MIRILAILAILGVALVSRGRADGISEQGLHYAGVLEEDGARVDGTRNLEVELWDDPTDL